MGNKKSPTSNDAVGQNSRVSVNFHRSMTGTPVTYNTDVSYIVCKRGPEPQQLISELLPLVCDNSQWAT